MSRLAVWALVALFLVYLVVRTVGATRPASGPEPALGVGAPAQRIVSLAPNVTEMLFALGVERQIVACTRNCDYPAAARALPKVGDITLDVEAIVAARPDLVIAESITPRPVIERLEALGLRVLALRSDGLQGYRRSLEALGRALGREREALGLWAALEQRMRELTAQRRGQPAPTVFVEVGSHPLWTAARGSLVDDLLGVAGGRNICHDMQPPFPKVDPELVVVRDPEIILLTTIEPRELGALPGFSGLSAVRAGRVQRVDANLLVRPGPRLVQGLEVLSRALYPASGAPAAGRAGTP